MVRFTSFHRDGEYRYAEYDWYFQGDGSGDFSKPNVTFGHAELRNTPLFGIGRFSFTFFATLYITCGSFRVGWTYPVDLGFTTFVSGDSDWDDALELAPTKAADISEVDLKNPKLQWYNLNSNSLKTFIPMKRLP